ncbi:unnamed protein product [Scytosiphon promiscuus]
MGFFGMKLKPGQKEAVEVPPGWCLQLCTAALEPAKAGKKPRDVSATLWVQVEGDIGDSSYLLGSLQGGGPCAQIPVGHCLTSVDGEVIIEAKGSGIVHLTGFFNREYDPDMEYGERTNEMKWTHEGTTRAFPDVPAVAIAAAVDAASSSATTFSNGGNMDNSSSNKDTATADNNFCRARPAKDESGKVNGRKRAAGARSAASPSASAAGPSAESPSSAAQQRPAKNNADGSTSEMTKQERRRQRKRENKSTFGGGKLATAGKNVKICYEGCFPDGRVFDKNNNRRRPLQFRVGMQSVITGMDRGVEGMRVGGSREIAIPAALGYGARGTGPIPPNQDLVFRVELVDVLGK